MIKTILVPVGNAQGAEERLDLAVDLANKYDAHVTALYILTPMGDMVKSVPIEAYSGVSFAHFEKKISKSGVITLLDGVSVPSISNM